MAERYVAECPAKINLFLRVGEPDATGFHPLETEFQAIGFSDTLEVTVGGNGLEILGMELPPQNTVMRALRLMSEVATLPALGLKLTKRIPVRAGLGGGSSDAGGLLRVLRKLLPASVPDRDFLAVAKSVGADVPFFLVGGRANGSGYGEVLTALPDPESRWLVVAKPDVECATPEMYRRLDAARGAGELFPRAPGWVENDFQGVAPLECLTLMETITGEVSGPVGLCGSGSAVFGFAQSFGEALQCAAKCGRAWTAPTLGREASLAISEG